MVCKDVSFTIEQGDRIALIGKNGSGKSSIIKIADSVYANKGMGVTLAKLGQVEEGLEYLRKATRMTDADYMYPYYDLALTLIEHNRNDEARSVINEAKAKTPKFSSMEVILTKVMEQMKSVS
jgi:ATPase subunit of ABC transporter with duplicated ATPase domains